MHSLCPHASIWLGGWRKKGLCLLIGVLVMVFHQAFEVCDVKWLHGILAEKLIMSFICRKSGVHVQYGRACRILCSTCTWIDCSTWLIALLRISYFGMCSFYCLWCYGSCCSGSTWWCHCHHWHRGCWLKVQAHDLSISVAFVVIYFSSSILIVLLLLVLFTFKTIPCKIITQAFRNIPSSSLVSMGIFFFFLTDYELFYVVLLLNSLSTHSTRWITLICYLLLDFVL